MSVISALTALMLYSLVFGAVLAIMWGAWRLSGLQHHTDFALNRGVLMGAVVFAAAAAAVPFVLPHPDEAATQAMRHGLSTAADIAAAPTTSSPTRATAHSLISLGDLTAVYATGLAVSLMILAGKLIYLWCVIWQAKAVETDLAVNGVRLRGSSSSTPFTWGRWIVISERDYATHRRAILAHETVHRQQGHWIDLLALSAAGALTWYLPVVPMLRRDLTQCHEYAADAGAVASGIDTEAYQMMLIEHASGRKLRNSLVNSFNFCSIKKRIIMMQNKRSAASAWARALTFIPAAAITLAAVSTPAIATTVQSALPHDAVQPATETDAAPAPVDTVATDDSGNVFTEVEVKPSYRGGEQKLFADLATRIRYPKEAAINNIQGRVILAFVVEKDGSVGEVEVKRGVDPQLDAEAVRVVKTLNDFTPGKMNGKPVRVWYMLPITFRIAGNDPVQDKK